LTIESSPISGISHLTIKEIIALVIENNYEAIIRYVNYNTEYRERKLSNIRYANEEDNHMYLNQSHINAYCHYREENRDFKVERIVAIKLPHWNYWITKVN
jgi:predicted DNA-binding transcriptional regulator YafY